MMRRVLSLLGIVTLLFVLCPSEANAQSTQPTTHQLKLVGQTPFVGPNGTFTAELSTGSLPANAKLSLVIYGPVTTRSRLDRTIAGEQLGSALFSTPSVSINANQTTLSLPIKDQWPAPDNGTVLTQSGVYPVSIEATAANGSRLDSIVTHLLRLPSATTASTPLVLATTAVIDAQLGVSREGSPQLSDTQLQRASEQFRILASTSATPLTLAATPFLVQALAESGDSSARPDVQTRQTLSRPYVAIDAASLAAAGRESVITQEYSAGDNVLASTFEAAPDRKMLVLDPSVNGIALDQLARTGTRSVVLQSSQIRSSTVTDESAVLTQRFIIESANGTSFAAMANDDNASSRFVLTTDPILGAHHALAELMMLHEEQPGANRGAALTIPAATEPAAMKEFLNGLSTASAAGAASGSLGSPVLQPVTLDELFTRTAVATTAQKPVVREWTSNDPVDLGTYPAQLEQAQWNMIGLRSMLPEGGELITPIERTVLASAEATLSSAARVAVIDNADQQRRTLTSAISLPTSQKVTLTSSSGKIPLVITNALPVTALVRITVSSPKLEFPDGTTYEIVLSPSNTTRTDIEVTTRASGAFPLDVEVSTGGGGLPVATSRIDVRSTAISGLGLFVSILAGLFLLVWWARHFRHSRRARALVATDEPSPTSGG